MNIFKLFGLSDKGGPGEAEAAVGAMRGYIHYPLQEPESKAKNKKLNIIMIVVDSWRFDTFTNEITPNIFNFSGNSWNFRKHYSGGNATRSGIMSIFYGIPAIHNFWMNLLLEPKGPVLVHQMLEQGYEVKAFASASLASPEFNLTALSGVEGLRLKTPGKTASERELFITREFDAPKSTQCASIPFAMGVSVFIGTSDANHQFPNK